MTACEFNPRRPRNQELTWATWPSLTDCVVRIYGSGRTTSPRTNGDVLLFNRTAKYGSKEEVWNCAICNYARGKSNRLKVCGRANSKRTAAKRARHRQLRNTTCEAHFDATGPVRNLRDMEVAYGDYASSIITTTIEETFE